MRFYGRETELSVLERARAHSKTESQFTVVLGRRRIGKTKLILESLRDTKYVYLFIPLIRVVYSSKKHCKFI